MKKINNYIKYAGILFLLHSIIFTYGMSITKIIILIIGMLLIAYSIIPQEERIKNKAAIIIIAIISIFINPLSAILLFLSISEISSVKQINNNSPPEEELISSETRRIDILLKIGLAMILVSGILFATTSWEAITDLIKVIVLILMAITFIGLSKFSEIKLKIPSTTKAYYILGLSFFLLTWVGLGYFGIISDWFSYFGSGKLLVYFLTFAIFSTNLYLIGKKFSTKLYIYLGHLSSIISLLCILIHFNFSMISAVLILNIIAIIITFIPINNPIVEDMKVLNSVIIYVFWPLLVFSLPENSPNIIAVIAAMLNIINVLFIATKSENIIDKVFAAIISHILILGCSINITTSSNLVYIVLFSALTIFSLVMKYINKSEDKWIVNTNQILYHFASLIIILLTAADLPLRTLVLATIYLIYNTISSHNIKKINNIIDYSYNPIVILIFVCCLTNYMNTLFFKLNGIINLVITSVVYIIISQFAKQINSKKYYFVLTIISLIITFIANIGYKDAIVSCILTLLSIYIFLSVDNKEKTKKWLSYAFILLNVNNLCANLLPGLFGKILMILILALIILVVENENYKMINYFVIIIPFISILELLSYNYIAKIISIHTFIIYLLFLGAKFIVKNQKANDMFLTIAIIGTHLDLLFKQDLYIGLYIGVLSISIIFLTYNKEDYRKLFYSSIGIMVINIIIQLWEFWAKIPFWLYLLLAGISIVAFVTYKEIRKDQALPQKQTKEIKPLSPPKEQEKANENKEQKSQSGHHVTTQEIIRFCPDCGTKKSDGKFCGNCGRDLSKK